MASHARLHQLSGSCSSASSSGATGDPQRCAKRGTVILLIGFHWLWDVVDGNLFVADTRRGLQQDSLREQRHQFSETWPLLLKREAGLI